MLYWFVHKRSSGFTQIELLIIVVILGVLAAIAAPNVAGWYRQKEVDTALTQIETALQETQSEAIKRHQSCYLFVPKAKDDGTYAGKGVPIGGSCALLKDCDITKVKEQGNCAFFRRLKNVELQHNASQNPWTITFDSDGASKNPNVAGTLWLRSTDGTVQSKCLVLSSGIGLWRSGLYKNGKCTQS